MKYKLLIAAIFLSACSPMFVLRAGWEEGKILANREPIEELMDSEEIDSETKRKFQLVLDARDYAEEIGLNPGKSFTKYTDVERRHLLWVLSASEKTSFRPQTWWFPIVGTIAYKGFFDKEDAFDEAKELEEEGLDIFLRPSAAFSTLGWFNDPLLSTVLAYDDAGLVNLVLHEVLHNTVWIQDDVYFNETLANAVGSYAAYDFFLKRGDKNNAELTAARWHDELLFAKFLRELKEKLVAIYSNETLSEEEKLKQRQKVFDNAKHDWAAKSPQRKTKGYQEAVKEMNNAAIVSMEIYLKTPEIFEELYQANAKNIREFIAQIKTIEQELQNDDNPYKAIQRKVQILNEKSHSKGLSIQGSTS